jgi:heme exporter protein D
MSEALDLGKYAAFIWTAYGVSAFVLTGLIFWSVLSYRKSNAKVLALEENTPVYQKTKTDSSKSEPPSDTAPA